MAKFYTVQLDDLYLTSDGSSSGTPCKLELDGVAFARQTVAGNVDFRADGSPVFQTIALSTGKPLRVSIVTVVESVLDSLVDNLNDALETETPIAFVAVGDSGDLAVNVLPDPSEPIRFGEFRNGLIKNVVLRFITV